MEKYDDLFKKTDERLSKIDDIIKKISRGLYGDPDHNSPGVVKLQFQFEDSIEELRTQISVVRMEFHEEMKKATHKIDVDISDIKSQNTRIEKRQYKFFAVVAAIFGIIEVLSFVFDFREL